MKTNYAAHAAVWDWDAFDNTPEYQHWHSLSARYGPKILLPMCALAAPGDYLARRGCQVTAFDLLPEMVAEARKRFGHTPGLTVRKADIRTFDFPQKDFDLVISKDQDIHLLPDLPSVEQALSRLNAHLRPGGCLALECTLPLGESFESPRRVFHPRVPAYPDKQVWKESECCYNSEENRNYINQTVFIRQNGQTTSFPYSICLQYYPRESLLSALTRCGFSIKKECSHRDSTPWHPGDTNWYVEAVKEFAR